MTKEKLKSYLDKRIEEAQAVIDDFQKRFNLYPAHALGWSDNVFEAAAQLDFCKRLKDSLDHESCTIELIKANATDIVIRASMSPTHSTSPTANLLATYQNKAWADLLFKLNRFS